MVRFAFGGVSFWSFAFVEFFLFCCLFVFESWRRRVDFFIVFCVFLLCFLWKIFVVVVWSGIFCFDISINFWRVISFSLLFWFFVNWWMSDVIDVFVCVKFCLFCDFFMKVVFEVFGFICVILMNLAGAAGFFFSFVFACFWKNFFKLCIVLWNIECICIDGWS